MKATLLAGAVSFLVMLAMVVFGHLAGLGEQPGFHFAAGFFVGVVFTSVRQYGRVFP